MSHAKAIAITRRHACEADIDLIWALMKLLRPALTVILGAGSGTMSTAWWERRRAKDCLISVDSDPAALDSEFEMWKGSGFSNGSHSRYTTQWIGDSATAGWLPITSSPVDLLIVDADHSYEGVRGDLEAWMPHVPVGGAIMLHDYDARHAPEFYPGVKQAADELLLLTTWELIEQSGWSAAWRRIA